MNKKSLDIHLLIIIIYVYAESSQKAQVSSFLAMQVLTFSKHNVGYFTSQSILVQWYNKQGD